VSDIWMIAFGYFSVRMAAEFEAKHPIAGSLSMLAVAVCGVFVAMSLAMNN